MGERKQNMGFEADVRRVAEAVWNLEPGMCQPMHYPDNAAVRELDGVARLRDVSHLIMATVSTRLDKIKDDVKKLIAAENIERTKATAVSKWIITKSQVDAEHIEFARKQNVIVLTLERFQSRFFDATKYRTLRAKCAFGSARDPSTNSIDIADDAYVNLPMNIVAESLQPVARLPRPITIEQIVRKIVDGEIVLLRAPFGSGKSLTTREIFSRLAQKNRLDSTSPIPLTLNLREHWGEAHSDEMLVRHARMVGYSPYEDLVIAWRAGMCSLLLDGFDELAAQTVVRTDNKNFMRDARRAALRGVRDFTQKLPKAVGLFICGRDHYFDSISELVSGLGVSGKQYTIVDLQEFSERSAAEFLKKNGIEHGLPDWLPRKPLILSYLLRHDLFDEILKIDASQGFGHAWNAFLTQICEREATLESSSMEAYTLRSVLERLAESVRAKSSGTGPINGNDLADAYAHETGQTAAEGVLAQLQRLPGLTQRDSDPGIRSFVDSDMLAALQGGAFARQILSGFAGMHANPISELSDKAVGMAMYLLRQAQSTPETLVGVIEQLHRRSGRERVYAQTLADCLIVAVRMAIEADSASLSFRALIVDGACFGRIPLDEIQLKGISFRNCTIREIGFGDMSPTGEVSFEGCLITKVSGIANEAGLPAGVIAEDCVVEGYDNMGTNSAVLQLDIPPQMKALITVLRKLYKQAGSGRKIAAFSRGITRPEVLRYIEPMVALLQRHQFISIFNQVVQPVRKQAARVENILASPMLSDDELVKEARQLT